MSLIGSFTKYYYEWFEIPTQHQCYMMSTKEMKSPKRKLNEEENRSFTRTCRNIIRAIADSGADKHMINIANPENFRPSKGGGISLANGFSIPYTGRGDHGVMRDCLVAPDLSNNLFSIPHSCSEGNTVVFDNDFVRVYNNDDISISGQPYLEGTQQDGSYFLQISESPEEELRRQNLHKAFVASAQLKNTFTTWHNRLPHANLPIMQRMFKQDNWQGLGWHLSDELTHKENFCHGCAKGKMTMADHRRNPLEEQDIGAPGELFFMDLMFSNVRSDSSKTCALVIVDASSRKAWVKTMAGKHATLNSVKEWVQEMKACGAQLKNYATIRTDPGGEFDNEAFKRFMNEANITPELAPPLAHIAMVERTIRTIKEACAAYLHAATYELTNAAENCPQHFKTPYVFWAEAVHHAVYVINKLPYKQRAEKSRNQMFDPTIEKEDMTNLRVFGCRALCKNYASLKSSGRAMTQADKKELGTNAFPTWHDKALEAIYLGHSDGSALTARLFIIKTGQIVDTENCIFNENLLQLEKDQLSIQDLMSIKGILSLPDIKIDQSQRDTLDKIIALNHHLIAHEFTLLDDYEQTQDPKKATAFQAKELLIHPQLEHYEQVQPESVLQHRALSAHEDHLPTNYEEAISGPDADKWIQSTRDETDSLIENHSIKVTLRAGKKVLGRKWVFKRKVNDKNNTVRWKSRYTIRGDQQIEGIDYKETFSPVLKYKTLRTLCAITAVKDLHMEQLDVQTAFLYGRMDDEDDPEVYIELPENFPIPPEFAHIPRDQLCGIAKSAIYGLKQASRKFNRVLTDFLLSNGFKQSEADPCLFSREDEQVGLIYVATFVDDILVSADRQTTLDDFKELIQTKFKMSLMGPVENILGMKVTRDRSKKTITLSQEFYAKEACKKFGITKSSDVRSLPLRPDIKLSQAMCPTSQEELDEAAKIPYKEILGTCMYLMVSTRPDIAFAVGKLCKYMHNYGVQHGEAAFDLLRYINKTKSHGITFGISDNTQLEGFSDADYAEDADERKSTSGYIFYLGGGPIHWRSQLQKVPAQSATEAEYVALAEASKEAVFLIRLCADLGASPNGPVIIHEDNTGAISLSKNPVDHDRTKHIDVRHHVIRQYIRDKLISIHHVSTKKMIADFLTKNINTNVYHNLCDYVMGRKDFMGLLSEP